MKKNLIIVLLFGTLLLTGCGSTNKDTSQTNNKDNQQQVEEKVEFKENTEYPRTVTVPQSYFDLVGVPVDYFTLSLEDSGKEVKEENGGISFEIDKEFMTEYLDSLKEPNRNADMAKTFDEDFKMEVTDDFANVTFTVGEAGQSDDNVLGLMNAIVANYGYLQCLNGQSDWGIHTRVVDTSGKVLFEGDVPDAKIELNK